MILLGRHQLNSLSDNVLYRTDLIMPLKLSNGPSLIRVSRLARFRFRVPYRLWFTLLCSTAQISWDFEWLTFQHQNSPVSLMIDDSPLVL